MNKITATLAAGVGVILPMQFAFADSDGSTLTALWRQWSYSIPADQNPAQDTTGQYCMVGQRGSVWFLAGIFQGSAAPIKRTCSVPEGATLFFPIINTDNINAPNVCGDGPEEMRAKQLRPATKRSIDSVFNLNLQVDGHNANRRITRVQSPVYAIALPDNNVFDKYCGGPGAVPAGIYSPSVDDGYYATISPLKPGIHKISFHAESDLDPKSPLVEDVSYTVTVVAVSLK